MIVALATPGDGYLHLWSDEDAHVLRAGNGNDLLEGGAGDDVLFGGSGVDNLRGDDGDDDLYGGGGDDNLRGGDGDDVLNGGSGNDVLYGNSGNDVFVFEGAWGEDIISGFYVAGNERLDFSSIGGITNMLDLTIYSSGPNTVIEFGTSSITLVDVTTDLLADDFIF